MMTIDKMYYEPLIEMALKEDLGDIGDITSNSIFDENVKANAIIKSKEKGVMAGSYLIEPLYKKIDNNICVDVQVKDGDELDKDKIICNLSGSIRTILSGERTILNFLQRLSGVATKSRRMSQLLKDFDTVVLDTRKTTPGYRYLEKAAVAAGGATNHRVGLFDMVLIKDTHVKAAGGPARAINACKKYISSIKRDIKIEVEVQNFDELKEAVSASPDIIMLDNMDIETMKKSVDYVRLHNSNIKIEASGNVTEENIKSIAMCGVDYISSGSLTHSVKALDIHLVIV